jgi:hypothetical protein
MRTLIIHHFESMWEEGIRDKGLDLYRFAALLMDHMRVSLYDRVILTRFEDDRLEDIHHDTGLSEYIDVVHEYGYGWERGMIDGAEDDTWAEGGYHSEIVYLPEWMKALPDSVDLCGAFDGECIEDMEIALDACGKDVNRVEMCIV